MHTLWLTVLGLFTAGYLVLDGFTSGLGLVLPRAARTDAGRRRLLAGLGPFFLAGEVWLVGAAGVFLSAFPRAEGTTFARLYPLLTALLCAIAVRDMAVHLRSRRPSGAWRATWDRLFTAASGLLAVTWGVVLGELAQGLPHRLLNVPALLSGAGFVALTAVHGTVFARWRGGARTSAARAGVAVTSAAVAAFALVAGSGMTDVLRHGAADRTTLMLLTGAALPAALVVGACQVWLWKVFLRPGPRLLYW